MNHVCTEIVVQLGWSSYTHSSLTTKINCSLILSTGVHICVYIGSDIFDIVVHRCKNLQYLIHYKHLIILPRESERLENYLQV